MMVTVANQSSAATSRRVHDQKRHAALQGKAANKGTHSRAFGYSADGMTIDKAEGKLFKKHAAEVADGRMTVADVVRALNDANVPTIKNGGRWSWNTVYSMFSNPRYAGLRSVTRFGVRSAGERASYYEILKTDEGVEVQGQWKGIIDRELFDRLQVAIGSGPMRRSDRDGKATQLMVGILRCGKCGAGLYADKRILKSGPSHKYRCPAPSNGGCRGVCVDGPAADLDIESRYTSAMLHGKALVESPPVPDGVDAEIARLTELFKAEKIDATAWAIGTTELRNKKKTEERKRQPIGVRGGAQQVKRYLSAPMVVRRRYLKEWAGAIVVLPAEKGIRCYREDRLVVTYDSDSDTRST